ncbi:YqeB family protein [Actinophytocola sp. KF-1]
MGDERISESTGTRLVRWAGLPVAGAVVVWLLKLLANWAVTWPWAPFRGPMELVDSVPEPWATVGALGVGLVGGLVLALIAHGERLDVTVSPGHVRLVGDEYDETFARDDVSAVFVDRNQLVLLGSDTGELVRRPSELDVAALRAAFTRHGYPWRDGDPHAGEYRRWVPGVEGLPPGANALLTARAKNPDDADELRAELARLGVIVRDEKRKQYWRPAR